MEDTKITLNIGGTKFVTTVATLTKAAYFSDLYKEYDDVIKDELFFDRSPEAFTEILNHLRNPKHKIPEKYLYECDYYGVKYDQQDVEKDKLDKLNNKLTRILDINEYQLKLTYMCGYKYFDEPPQLDMDMENECTFYIWCRICNQCDYHCNCVKRLKL